MPPDHLTRVRQLYVDALKLHPGERAAFLARKCSDPGLRAQVESLLSESGRTRTLHSASAGNPEPRASNLAEPDMVPTLLNTRLKGRYLVRSVLGRGGFSVVYLAADEQLLSKKVVVKVLLNAAPHSWERKKFGDEMAALARLNHPNIVSVSDSGETQDGRPFLVMEYIDGAPLRSLMRAEGMDLGTVADVIREVGRALDAAHRSRIWHRDLKPENIMIQTLEDGERRIKLIDFGIAIVKSAESSAATSGHTAGTLGYMAPEQIAGKPSAATDLYSLAVIAYEMITGRLPFAAKTSVALYLMQREEVRVKPRALRPQIPEDAEQPILRALRFDEDARYPSIGSFIQDLVPALRRSEAPVKSEPHYGRLVSKMCDRRCQDDEFRGFLARSGVQYPGCPVFCIIHGEEGECHESLVERLAYQAELLARRQEGDERSSVNTLKIPWQDEGTAEARLRRLVAWLFESFSSNRGLRLDDTRPAALADLLASSFSAFIFLQHDIRAARWDDRTKPFAQAYSRYLAELPRPAAGPQLIVCLNVIYPRGASAELRRRLLNPMGLIRQWNKARIHREFAEIANPRGEGAATCPCLLLDELKPISRDDVLDWFSLHNILESEEERIRAVGRIFGGAGAMARKSMAEIETQLRSVQHGFLLERGAI